MIARTAFALAAGLWLAAAGRDAFDGWVAATDLPVLAVETGPEVLARDGRALRVWTVADGRWRLAVSPDRVDPFYPAMLTAFEDRRFASHPGVDWRALARAGWQAATTGRVVSGGSTLTMQVARLLEDSGTGAWRGKLRQMRVALALERVLTKDQILGLYLHLAPYGGNIEGVRAASLAWFGREPARLTPAQAALLVALPQSPTLRRPDRNPDAARQGRDRVLDRALAAGVIDAETHAAARAEPLPAARQPFPRLAPHLADRMRAAHPERLRIETTLDADLQARLERLAAETVAPLGERLQVAMIVADHRSGEILGSVGSAAYDNDPRQGFVDMTQALRSPGSTLKPLVYALAFDQGLAHPETLIEDRPVTFGAYAPQNFDRQFRGTVKVKDALQLSLNIPVVSLTEALGPERLMQALRRAGAAARVPGNGAPGLAVALGGVGISLEHLAGSYAALARGGVARPLSALSAGGGDGERLVSQVAAWQVGHVLAGIAPPDGSAPGRIAWKTGTSYGHRDTWALGWDGRHVAGVWLGRADGTPVPGAFGAGLAGPVLFSSFARIAPRTEPLPPPPPAALLVENARLPQPLQRFRSGGTATADGPEIAFPPSGAEIALDGGPLLARIRGGLAPFTWLADGVPVAVGTQAREVHLAVQAGGPVTLSVIDAAGQASRVQIAVQP